MLVVMQADASPAEIEAVCQRARDAGFEPTVYDVEPAVIMVAGEQTAEAAAQFAALPGVARIAHPRSLSTAGDQQPAHRRHPPPGAPGDPGRAVAAPGRERGHGAAHAPGGEPHPARGRTTACSSSSVPARSTTPPPPSPTPGSWRRSPRS